MLPTKCASHARAAGADLARVVQIQCMTEAFGMRKRVHNKPGQAQEPGRGSRRVLWRTQNAAAPGGNSLSTKSSAKLSIPVIAPHLHTVHAVRHSSWPMLRMAPRLNRGPLARLPTAVKSSLAPWQVRSSLRRTRLLACHSTSAFLIRCICAGRWLRWQPR